MTLEEFKNHGWKGTDKVVYEGKTWEVFQVDFLGNDDCHLFIGANFMFPRWVNIEEVELCQPEIVKQQIK